MKQNKDVKFDVVSFANFLMPYILVILIVFMILSTVGISVLHALEKNAVSIVETTVDGYISEIEQSLEQIENTSLSIARSKDLKRFFDAKSRNEILFDEMVDLRKTLNSYFTGDDMIADAVLQNNIADVILDFATEYSSREKFYNTKIKSEELSGAELLQKSVSTKSYAPWGMCRFDSVVNVLPFVLNYPLLEKEPESNIIIYINREKLFSNIDKLLSYDGGAYFVTNKKNELLLSSNSKIIENEDITTEDGIEKRAINGENFWRISKKSQRSKWNYQIYIPETYVMGNVKVYRIIFVVFTFLSLLVSVFVGSYIALKKSAKYSEVLKMLKIQDKMRGIKRNEFENISSSIQELQKKNDEFSYGSRQNTLKKLLLGDFKSVSEMENLLATNSVLLKNELYATISIHNISKHQSAFFKDNYHEFIKGEIKELIPCSYVCFSDNNKMTVIFPVGTDGSLFEESVKKNISQLECDIFLKYDIPAWFGAGMPVCSLEDFCRSYKEANSVIEYNRLFDNPDGGVILYSNLPDEREKYYYPIEIENLLFKHSLEMNFSGIESVLQRIQYENFNERCLSTKNIKDLLSELETSIEKIALQLSVETEFERGVVPVGSFFRYVHNYLYLICANEPEEKTRPKQLCEKIKDYIDENYADPNISLFHLAEKFNLNQSYLSTLFKKNMNCTWSVYLENVRIEKAALLLLEGKLSVKEISDKVGFSNDGTFRRRFKHVKGVNPTNFSKTKN